MSVPQKYRELMTFWKYYSGAAVAPIPTLFSERLGLSLGTLGASRQGLAVGSVHSGARWPRYPPCSVSVCVRAFVAGVQ